MNKPLVLMILDGWGVREEPRDNAIAQGKTPHYDGWLRDCPHALLDASGKAVGLLDGIMGNSDVGHLNIGSGRIARVGLTRIFQAIEDGSFYKNPALLQAMEAARDGNKRLHLLGLLSDGAVHSHQDHLYALLKMAAEFSLKNVMVHAFMDGRDTDPKSGLGYLQALEKKMAEIGAGKIATVSGRFYAMDRDKRWERIARAYQALVEGEGETAPDAVAAIQRAYERGETDEFVVPTVIVDAAGRPVGTMEDSDAAVFFNFRADRARELTRALTDMDFKEFARKRFPRLSPFVTMARYDETFALPVAFEPVHLTNTFGELISHRGLKQLRIAETEKYAHVTYFFNGGEEKIFPGEERILVPSPREVPTYDLKPEMSAPAITDKVLECIASNRFDVIILNFANADMVGHSGNLPATIKAVETLDRQMGRIAEAVERQGGCLLITADHGNCEKMADEKGNPHTAHTTSWVPFILVGRQKNEVHLKARGILADIAPTMLQLLGIPKPKEMTGQSLIVK